MAHQHDDDYEPTPAERARAASLGRLVDGLLAGAQSPPALDAEDRALLETAAIIRGSVAEPVAVTDSESVSVSVSGSGSRLVPWALAAAFAAAAIVALLIHPNPSAARLPAELRSRSADGLVGPIDREGAAAARQRTDLLYADRLAGYRLLSLGSRGGRP
jgi:hypothetical protein